MNQGLNDPGEPREQSEAQGWKETGRPGTSLPPPVFPPGGRRSKTPPKSPGETSPEGRPVAWSDSTIWVRAGLAGALILPDDPIPARDGGTAAAKVADGRNGWARTASDEIDVEEAVVTGIGDDPHLSSSDLLYAWDADLAELGNAVRQLAADLDRQGEAGLKATPGMTRLDTQLRAYCAGFLAGRRGAGTDV